MRALDGRVWRGRGLVAMLEAEASANLSLRPSFAFTLPIIPCTSQVQEQLAGWKDGHGHQKLVNSRESHELLQRLGLSTSPLESQAVFDELNRSGACGTGGPCHHAVLARRTAPPCSLAASSVRRVPPTRGARAGNGYISIDELSHALWQKAEGEMHRLYATAKGELNERRAEAARADAEAVAAAWEEDAAASVASTAPVAAAPPPAVAVARSLSPRVGSISPGMASVSSTEGSPAAADHLRDALISQASTHAASPCLPL